MFGCKNVFFGSVWLTSVVVSVYAGTTNERPCSRLCPNCSSPSISEGVCLFAKRQQKANPDFLCVSLLRPFAKGHINPRLCVAFAAFCKRPGGAGHGDNGRGTGVCVFGQEEANVWHMLTPPPIVCRFCGLLHKARCCPEVCVSLYERWMSLFVE